MIKASDGLILEVFKQYEALKFCIFSQNDTSSTVRHYQQQRVSFNEIKMLSRETVSILNRIERSYDPEPDLLKSFQKTAQLLWDHLLPRQIKDRLKNSASTGLTLSLDEELIDIPWELVFDGHEFLCLKFNIGRLVRTKEYVAPALYRDINSTIKMLILANPTNDLKSAYEEGLNIKNQFDKKRQSLHVDFKSNRVESIYVKKTLRDYDIVHFAGHCEYDADEPEKSGWVLNDGRFSIEDILALGHSHCLPNLVFSNACNSASQQNESIGEDYQTRAYNLAAAFLFSGVKHYIGVARRIEDKQALIFAREFYSRLLNGQSMGEAVRQARLKLFRQDKAAGLSWANYLFYGDPDFRVFKSKNKAFNLSLSQLLHKHKKGLLRALAVTGIAVGLALSFLLIREISPTDRYLYTRARNMYLKGDNTAAASTVNRIIGRNPRYLAAYALLGDVYQRQGDFDRALKYYFDYALHSQKKADMKNLAIAYNGIGWLYYNNGNYPKAMEFYEKALEISRKYNDKLNEATSLRRMATWYVDKQEHGKALELLAKSSEINRNHPNSREHKYNLACDYFSMAYVFTDKDDYASAKEFYEKSRKLFVKLKLPHELSDCYFNMGEIASFEKDYKKALEYYDKGIKIDQSRGNLPALAADYNMLGELYAQMGAPDEALEQYGKTIKLCKQIDAPQELAWAYHNTGLLYKEKNQKNKAREFFRSAQEIYRKIDTPAYQEIRKDLLSLDE
jgi:tetratricopeptide (TPR) repeat protein